MIELVYGGSGSGKSEFAEKRILELAASSSESRKYYLATMKPYGEEGKARILRHKKLREGKGFITIEKPVDLGELEFSQPGSVLLECAGNLMANEMFRDDGGAGEDDAMLSAENAGAAADACKNQSGTAEGVAADARRTEGVAATVKSIAEVSEDTADVRPGQAVADKVFKDIQTLARNPAVLNLVIVSNNVFEDGIEYDKTTMEYIRAMGRLNCKLGEIADAVTEVVAGIPLPLSSVLEASAGSVTEKSAEGGRKC